MRALFYKITGDDRSRLYDTAAAECVRLFRSLPAGSRICVMVADRNDFTALSKKIWTTDGFIPCAAATDPNCSLSPVVIGSGFMPGSSVLVNLQLGRTQYTETELGCDLIVDFIADTETASIPVCRERYRQLKNITGGVEFKTI